MHYSDYLENLGFVKLTDSPELDVLEVYINFDRSIVLTPGPHNTIVYLSGSRHTLTRRESCKLVKLFIIARSWKPPTINVG